MLIKRIFLLGCLAFCMPNIGFSACNKDDIEFYLEKGFSQEQITQLCAASEAAVPDYKPYQQQVIIYREGEGPGIKDGFTRDERVAIKDLQQGADVAGLVVDQESIQYTVKICLAVQEGKEYSRRFKTCPEVFYKVLRSGLVVTASGKKYGVLGKNAIVIQGIIKRESKQDFDDYPVQFKKQLKRHFDWKTKGNTTRIPVRGDYSVTRLVNALNALSTAADANVNLAQHETGSNPDKMTEEAKVKKKKRWWNPFD